MNQRVEYLLPYWSSFWKRSSKDCVKEAQRATLYLPWSTKTYTTRGDFNQHIVLPQRRHHQIQQTNCCLSLWQLHLLFTTQSSPGSTTFFPLVSFGMSIVLRFFSPAFFKTCYITVSCRASYFKALLFTRKLGTLWAATSPVGIVWHRLGAGQNTPSVATLLCCAVQIKPLLHVAQLHHFHSEPSGPWKHKPSLPFCSLWTVLILGGIQGNTNMKLSSGQAEMQMIPSPPLGKTLPVIWRAGDVCNDTCKVLCILLLSSGAAELCCGYWHVLQGTPQRNISEGASQLSYEQRQIPPVSGPQIGQECRKWTVFH